MATKATALYPARLAEQRQALYAALSSSTFKKNPRLLSLLEYICNKYFEGDTDDIKEYSIAVEFFRRPETFDQTTDSIVRVEFHRLRRKLREFYSGEGANQPIEIIVATGHYLPEFVDRVNSESCTDVLREEYPEPGREEPVIIVEEPILGSIADIEAKKQIFTKRNATILCALVAGICICAIALGYAHHASAGGMVANPPTIAPVGFSGTEVRIRCGYNKEIFKDQGGNVWMGDRYFSGGFPTELPNQHIARTRDSQLYLTLRSGTFSYKIPLKPGTYEMRLYFAETTYSPASAIGGGENSRVFDVQLNGKPLLTQFDIVSDAGANTADVRVFKDVHPGPDGNVRLDFSGSLGLPMINAIEIVPGTPHRLRPIRMVAQNNFFVDKSGNVWSPDTYFAGGQLAEDKISVGGTEEPGLYAGERYGHFSYALPADSGSYAITLFLSEKYWGTDISKQGGVGSRVFDVLCNGIALARTLDIVKEAGSGRAFQKTFHGIRPNAQGKLIVEFVPDVNYAAMDAIEVEEEIQ